MLTQINTSDYNRVTSINLHGTVFKSSYNHNYYYNKNTGDLILEAANDDQTCFYYRVEENGHSVVKNYLGFTEDQYGFGIFDKNYEGYPERDEHNIIVLDSNNS